MQAFVACKQMAPGGINYRRIRCWVYLGEAIKEAFGVFPIVDGQQGCQQFELLIILEFWCAGCRSSWKGESRILAVKGMEQPRKKLLWVAVVSKGGMGASSSSPRDGNPYGRKFID